MSGGNVRPGQSSSESRMDRILGERRTGPARWVLAVAVFSAVLGTSLSLKGVLADFSWLPQVTFVVALTVLVPALLRRRAALGPYAPIGALAGWLVSLTMLFFPSTAVLGILPTTRTISAAIELSREASSVIMSNVAPAPTEPSMVFLAAAGLGFAALLIDTAAITIAMPAAGALGIVLIMLPAALMTASGIGTSGFVGAAMGYLLLLGTCRWYAPDGILRRATTAAPSGTLGRAAVLGAAVVLLMAMLPAVVPGFTQGVFPQGARLSQQNGPSRLDPMISLGANLREQSSRVSLTYMSNTNTAQYMRLSTLEDFTGKSWQPSKVPEGLSSKLVGLTPAAGASPDVPRQEIITAVTADSLDSDWLPAPLSVQQVDDLNGDWRWNPSTQTIKGLGSSTRDQSYLVRSDMPELTRQLLASATAAPRAGLDPIFTEMPKNVPALVRDTAKQVAGAAATPYQKAMAIQDYLRSDAFSYSLDTPADEGYDGSGMAVLEAFLKEKSGYCVHFSAAMAVMSRELGIPSRIAVGYAPGAANLEVRELDGITLFGYQATGRDAHAWPELYFEGLGWVPFEPTPSRGAVPDYAEKESSSTPGSANVPVPEQPNAVTTAPTPTPTPSAVAGSESSTATDDGPWLVRTGAVLLVLLVLLSPSLLRQNVRRRRLATVRRAPDAVAGDARPVADPDPDDAGTPEAVAWREFIATAVDYGYISDAARTPALHTESIASMLGSSAPVGLALLRSSYEGVTYGGVSSPEAREDLAETLEIVRLRFQGRATLAQRLRATFLPASLFQRS